MHGKQYVTIDQWFNGHRTVDYNEVVTLPEDVAAPLVKGGYLKPVEEAPAAAPQNRAVSTAGTAGPKKGK